VDAKLEPVRAALLDLHREILAAERYDMERLHGAMSGAEFLQVVTDSLRYSWLLPLSELIVAIDEDDPEPDADAVLDRLRALVAPPDPDTAFGQQYLRLLQHAPGVVLAHSALTRAL
jgi:hypothetical protein